ncbi:MAG: DUF3108 domain-containing protein [Bacteroides sp.]|nr:DUF3108 domain-containing protein [Bacteroides sp.]
MKKIFTIVFLAILSLLIPSIATAADFANEKLSYVITYKWGLIQKDAGDAVLSSRLNNGKYTFTLTAKTKPWADKFFPVRDTLTATVLKNGFVPQRYVKIAHEGDKFAKDVITYTHSAGHVGGKCERYRDKNGSQSTAKNTLTATGPTFDMLSVFYFLRIIDYNKLTKGSVTKLTIFSGSKAETLTIRGLGREKIKLRDKTQCEAYRISFTFTTGGKKKSSDDINCWISADDRRIPLLLIGTLPVGQVKCYYTGK